MSLFIFCTLKRVSHESFFVFQPNLNRDKDLTQIEIKIIKRFDPKDKWEIIITSLTFYAFKWLIKLFFSTRCQFESRIISLLFWQRIFEHMRYHVYCQGRRTSGTQCHTPFFISRYSLILSHNVIITLTLFFLLFLFH